MNITKFRNVQLQMPSRRVVYTGTAILIVLSIALAAVTHADERGDRSERKGRPDHDRGAIVNISGNIGDRMNFHGIARLGTTTSTWTIHATNVGGKTWHAKSPEVFSTSTVHAISTTTAQARIDDLLRVIERLQAIVNHWKIQFGL